MDIGWLDGRDTCRRNRENRNQFNMKKIFLMIVLLLIATALCASPMVVFAVNDAQSKVNKILPVAPSDQQLPAEDFETQIVPNIIKIFLCKKYYA